MVEGTANTISFQQACVLSNNYFPMDDRHSGLICQHALANIVNVSERFIKSLHQQTKPHVLFGRFPNRQKGNKEVYGYILGFTCRLKEDIGEPTATRYVREITSMTTRDEEFKKVFIPHHTSKHHYYVQW